MKRSLRPDVKSGAASGIKGKAAHFPGRAAIDAYGNGGFSFAEMSHQGSILALPDGIHSWDVARHEDLTPEHFSHVFACSDMEVFLLGMGAQVYPLRAALRSLFKERGIALDTMSTGAAARTYNILLSESRAVGCGLIAVD